jgi:aspartate-semialdehyde dehydrogenase
MRVAVVGATGMVGEVMLQVLAERNFPVTELIPVASEKSVGKEIEYNGKKYYQDKPYKELYWEEIITTKKANKNTITKLELIFIRQIKT